MTRAAQTPIWTASVRVIPLLTSCPGVTRPGLRASRALDNRAFSKRLDDPIDQGLVVLWGMA